MDEDDVTMKTVASAKEAGDSWNDSIVARSGIIVKIDKCFATGIRDVVFQFFHEHGSGGFVTWAGSVLTGVDSIRVGRLMEKLLPFYSDESVEVGFIDMYYSESVDFIIAGFFLDHHVDDGFPAVICEAVADGVIDEADVCGY